MLHCNVSPAGKLGRVRSRHYPSDFKSKRTLLLTRANAKETTTHEFNSEVVQNAFPCTKNYMLQRTSPDSQGGTQPRQITVDPYEQTQSESKRTAMPIILVLRDYHTDRRDSHQQSIIRILPLQQRINQVHLFKKTKTMQNGCLVFLHQPLFQL